MRFHTRHLHRINLIAVVHTIDTETLQLAVLIHKAQSVAVAERFHTGHDDALATDFLYITHFLAQ